MLCVDVNVLLYAVRQDLPEWNATWLSADRGFARFPNLRWRHPTTV